MTPFQLLLLLTSGVIFYLFFRQLVSGSFPKRGVDFESKLSDKDIGSISRADKFFHSSQKENSRLNDLEDLANEAVEKKDWAEASKAIGAGLVIEPNNEDMLYKMAYVELESGKLDDAKLRLQSLLSNDKDNDMAHAMLANILHKMGEDEEALVQHKDAINIDSKYAPHYFNYANTLLDMGKKQEALEAYKKAYSIDSSLEEAKKMIAKLSE